VRSWQYGADVLAAGPLGRRPGRREAPKVAAERGLVVEDSEGRFCGAVVGYEKGAVTLEDRDGRRRVFPLVPAAFLLDGQPVTLVPPAAGSAPVRPARTASGSVAAPPSQRVRARVARASRIYVEGKHDAELVEKIWGDDLREVGVVVEYLEGIDDLPAVVASFSPGPGRRLGVLVDHLVDGSKETRIAASARSPHVLIVGHPFIDIWAAVRPSAAGIAGWPDVPPGQPWKEGVLRALGWPPEVPAAWQRILRSVTSYADLEPALLGRVEELIDFVTVPGNELADRFRHHRGGRKSVTTAADDTRGPMTSKPTPRGPGPRVAGARAEDGPAGGRSARNADVTWARLGYLGAILGPVIPLVVYAIRRRRSPFIRYHAATALNLSLTWTLYALCCGIVGGLLVLDSLTVALVVALSLVFLLWLAMLDQLIRGIGAAKRRERQEVPGWICAQIAK